MLTLEKIVYDLHCLCEKSLKQDDLRLALSINKVLYTIWKDNKIPSIEWTNSESVEPIQNILNFFENHGQHEEE